MRLNSLIFQNFVDDANDLILIMSPMAKLVYVNKAAIEKLAIEKKQIGKDIGSVFDYKTKRALLSKIKKKESFLEGQIKLAKSNIFAELKITNILDSKGKVKAHGVIIRDMTYHVEELNQLKKRAEDMRRFSKFTVQRELKMIDLKQKIRDLGGKI